MDRGRDTNDCQVQGREKSGEHEANEDEEEPVLREHDLLVCLVARSYTALLATAWPTPFEIGHSTTCRPLRCLTRGHVDKAGTIVLSINEETADA